MPYQHTPLFTVVDRTTRMISIPGIPSTIPNPSPKEVAGSVLDDIGHYQSAKKNINTVSLFQYAKDTIIASRVFIEESLVDEAVLTDLMRNLLNLYAGMIITAVGLNSVVKNSRTARDILGVVATESWVEDIDTDKLADDYILGNRQYSIPEANLKKLTARSGATKDTWSFASPYGGGTSKTDNMKAKIVKFDEREGNLPSTRLLQLDIDTGALQSGKGGATGKSSATLNVLVQLRPRFIPGTVARAFVDLNFEASDKIRYLQMQAGEISFFKDFLLATDISKRRRKAMLDDKTGILTEMIEAQANSMRRHFEKVQDNTVAGVVGVGAGNAGNSANIANTILILDKRSFDQACSAAGVRFDNPSTRAEFFAKTYAMIVCIVDTSFANVTMYYNGIREGSTFNYRQLATNAKTDATDLITIMKNYAAGTAPRF